MQDLHKALTKNIDETQVDLQVVMWTKSLIETIKDTREHLHKELKV
jgi:hypothetical protein